MELEDTEIPTGSIWNRPVLLTQRRREVFCTAKLALFHNNHIFEKVTTKRSSTYLAALLYRRFLASFVWLTPISSTCTLNFCETFHFQMDPVGTSVSFKSIVSLNAMSFSISLSSLISLGSLRYSVP
jgi:hypothetical protein